MRRGITRGTIIGFILITGSLLFGILQYREVRLLQDANRRLEAHQNSLLQHVQDLARANDSLRTLSHPSEQPRPQHSATAGSFPARLDPIPDIRQSNGLPVSFDNGDISRQTVALTFDGAAYDNAVEDILDTLGAHGVKATMFLTGGFITRYPESVRRMASDGHDVGNHTFTHPHLTAWEREKTHTTLPGISQNLLTNELRRTADAYRKVTGSEMLNIWRAPYGEHNRELSQWGQSAGYLHVGWRQAQTWKANLDSYDWVPRGDPAGYHSPLEICDKFMKLADARPNGINGGIILMHLGTERTEPDQQFHRYLGTLISGLQGKGYRFVTISEMLRESGIDLTSLHHQ